MSGDSMQERPGINREALAVLLLAAALVMVLGLWAVDRVQGDRAAGDGNGSGRRGTSDTIEWKLVTTCPKNLPGLGHTPEVFADMVRELSDGRLTVRVYGAGEIVPAFEVFDAVSSGVAPSSGRSRSIPPGRTPRFFLTSGSGSSFCVVSSSSSAVMISCP